MIFTILIGGAAGQGINRLSEIISKLLLKKGYFVFNYRDYQSLIRGGHNFNIISFSDLPIHSCNYSVDMLISLDKKTIELHRDKLGSSTTILTNSSGSEVGRDLNILLASKFAKFFGFSKFEFVSQIKEILHDKGPTAEKYFKSVSQETILSLKKINRKLNLMDGNSAIAIGAVSSGLRTFISYPMTPSTGLLHSLANHSLKNPNIRVFQPESEIAAINMAIGSSFAGNLTMVGTSGGGFDLMTEGLSFSGQAEIPIVIYLASRPGPSTGVPTYTSQDDLNLALHSGHGEFPRIVLAPGDMPQCIKATHDALLLAEKYKVPCILLSDKHLAESLFSMEGNPPKTTKIRINRPIPGKNKLVKVSSYEHNLNGETIEDSEGITSNIKNRLGKMIDLSKDIENLSPINFYGKKNSKNLIVTFGSTKNVLEDVVTRNNLDIRVLQLIYLEPFPKSVEIEIKKAKNVFTLEQNSTSQLSRLIREKTGFLVSQRNRILKYDGRPFFMDELKSILLKKLPRRS